VIGELENCRESEGYSLNIELYVSSLVNWLVTCFVTVGLVSFITKVERTSGKSSF